MSCSLNLYENNSLFFEAVITNPQASPVYVNDATVTVTLYDNAGNEVTGQTWPIALNYVLDSNGIYQKTTDPVSGIVAGERYKCVFKAVGGGITGEWEDYVVAEKKRCG